jgi:hypothetical protein
MSERPTNVHTPTLPLCRLNFDQDMIPNISLQSPSSHPSFTASSRAGVDVSLTRPNSSPSPRPPSPKRFHSLEPSPDALSDPFQSRTSRCVTSLDPPVFYPVGHGQLTTTSSSNPTQHAPMLERYDEDNNPRQSHSAFHGVSAPIAAVEENISSSSALSGVNASRTRY